MVRICLITPQHISFQPRLIREADSLEEAGYDVRIVSRQTDPMLTEWDFRLVSTRKWRLQGINICRGGPNSSRWLFEAAKAEMCKTLFDCGVRTVDLASRAYVRGMKRLIALAREEQADWFIAHTHGALPIAVPAAREWNARLGFDCEDLLAEADTDPPEIVRLIERCYLPLCDYVSVPSQTIAGRFMRDYRVDAPVVLYNVFPLRLVGRLRPPQERKIITPIRLFWFGQTIGRGRGIEEAVEATGMIGAGVELHLQGRIHETFRSEIKALGRERAVATKIVFHSPVDHDFLFETMGRFHIGLALERSGRSNYSQTVTNKIFAYLLGGLAVAASDTPGQREVMNDIPSAGFLYPAGDARALADKLSQWLRNLGALRCAQQAAWDAARQRFCWDLEKDKFLCAIQSTGRREVDRHERSGR